IIDPYIDERIYRPGGYDSRKGDHHGDRHDRMHSGRADDIIYVQAGVPQQDDTRINKSDRASSTRFLSQHTFEKEIQDISYQKEYIESKIHPVAQCRKSTVGKKKSPHCIKRLNGNAEHCGNHTEKTVIPKSFFYIFFSVLISNPECFQGNILPVSEIMPSLIFQHIIFILTQVVQVIFSPFFDLLSSPGCNPPFCFWERPEGWKTRRRGFPLQFLDISRRWQLPSCLSQGGLFCGNGSS